MGDRDPLSARALRALVDHASDIAVITDRTGVTRYVSPAVGRALGREPGTLTGELGTDLVHPDDVRSVRDAWRDILSAEPMSAIAIEFRVRHRDGTWRWVRQRLKNLLDQPDVDGVVASLTDITDERSALASLEGRETELRHEAEVRRIMVERHQLALRATSMATWEVDLSDASIHAVDPPTISSSEDQLHLAGFGTIYGFLEAVHVDDRDAVRDRFWHAIRHGTLWKEEFRLVLPQRTVWVATTGKRLPPGRVIGTIRAIDDEKRLQQQLEAQRVVIDREREIAAVGRAASALAHDLGNIITVITTNAELLEEEQGDNDYLRDVRHATRRANDLIDGLLTLSAPATAGPDAAVADVCRHFAAMLPTLVGDGIDVRTDISLTTGTVPLDEVTLERVLLNLAINARAAMPDGGTLLFTVELIVDASSDEDPASVIRIALDDDGSGMSSQVAEQAFEPFFTTKTRADGSGLGLSYVLAAVAAAGGDVQIQTEHGRGTTIEVLIPAT